MTRRDSGRGGHEDERERRGRRFDPLDTLEAREKKAGRGRPPPRRGLEALVDPSVQRRSALVVGALPAHVEVLVDPPPGVYPGESNTSDHNTHDHDAGVVNPRGGVTRADVQVARVHPALVAHLGSPLVVGDRVEVSQLSEAAAQLWAVGCAPRSSTLARPAVEREKVPQPIVANAGVLWVVVAQGQPPLRPGLVDRFFVAAAAGGLDFALLATKADLPAEPESLRWLAFYAGLGVTVVRTSAHTGEGLAAARSAMTGQFGVLVGQSGVGKSSLVRALLPGQPIAVGEMSAATGKGRHTTTVTRYYDLPEGGALVDTPGLRELGLWGADRAHLDRAFPDVTRVAEGCRFDDCRHDREPGCAVREAPAVAEERLVSWRKLSEEIDERLRPGFGRPGGPGGRGG